MKTLVLDGSHANDSMAAIILKSLHAHLPDAETVTLREKKIGNCAGDFFCWVRNPGICNTNDDNRVIAAKLVQSDLVISLTPVTFGGYSSELKRMVDHQIQNISPFFCRINGEVHHKKRYSRYPNMLTIGWMEEPDDRPETIFRHLVHRNAINLQPGKSVCRLVTTRQSEAELNTLTGRWLESIFSGENSPAPSLPPMDIASTESKSVGQAVLLVGSPRTNKSTSSSLGGFLFEQLRALGVETKTFQIYSSINSEQRMQVLLDSVNGADLVALAFPLYVDSLPAPVTGLLEKIAAYREGGGKQGTRFSAIVNCGFPEAHQNNTALSICSEFARQSGFAWIGGLSLGGGEGLVHGVPLNDMGGRVSSLKKALTLAAEALADGKPIPRSAQDLFSKPIIPAWLYTFIGGFGWKRLAKKYGMQKSLMRQPYLTENPTIENLKCVPYVPQKSN